jgi:plasmid maintenance system antidote protein VapI
MKSNKKLQEKDFKVEIGLDNPEDLLREDTAKIDSFFQSHIARRSPQRVIKNALLAVQYKMEEYLERDDIKANKYISLEDFLSEFLKILNLSFKHFAIKIDTSDANLKKYLKGDRKFNTELAMKFGNFFHTNPELWLRLYLKNEFIQLNAAKKDRKYAKYDYEKQLELS